MTDMKCSYSSVTFPPGHVAKVRVPYSTSFTCSTGLFPRASRLSCSWRNRVDVDSLFQEWLSMSSGLVQNGSLPCLLGADDAQRVHVLCNS